MTEPNSPGRPGSPYAPPPRDAAFLAECLELRRAIEVHPSFQALEAAPQWPSLRPRLAAVLGHIRRFGPAAAPVSPVEPRHLRVLQWNLEHGNAYEAIERALLAHPALAGADVLTLDEVDLGCARSGNRDVAGDLAAALGLDGAWAPLFVETTAGRDDDARRAAGRDNQEGLFGIAVLSRWPLGDARLVELPSPRELQFDIERMVGRHVALIVEVLRPGAPFVAVATHLEVHRRRADRARQMRVIVDALAGEPRPVVIAGDFNSHTFDRGLWHSAAHGALVLGLTPGPWLRSRLLRPDRGPWREPLFDELWRGGFAWEPFADFAPTLRLRDDRLAELRSLPAAIRVPARRLLAWAVRRGELRLDWICARGWSRGSGSTVPGLDGPGLASDHAPLVADLVP